MKIYKYEDYRKYLADALKTRPNQGRGEIGKIARYLNVHSTLMSLIFSGKRELSKEQAYGLCDYLQLTESETDYFLLLNDYAKAGTAKLRSYLLKKIKSLQTEALQVKNIVEKDYRILNDQEKSIFYSSWLYSGVRLFCSIDEKGKSFDDIQKRFRVDRDRLIEILQFLLKCQLLSEKKGLYIFQTQRTFLEYGSPHIIKHQLNWRARTLSKIDQITKEELLITSPMSVSRKDFQKIKEEIMLLVAKTSQIIKESNAEDVACMNIDLFWIE